MKNFIVLFLVLLLGCSPVLGNDTKDKNVLTPETIQSLQLSADILSECLITEISPYVSFGFSTEYSVKVGFFKCTEDGMNLVNDMSDAGLTPDEIQTNLTNLKDNVTVAVNKQRDKLALERLKKYLETQEGKRSL